LPWPGSNEVLRGTSHAIACAPFLLLAAENSHRFDQPGARGGDQRRKSGKHQHDHAISAAVATPVSG
jgi:hypothetical protein